MVTLLFNLWPALFWGFFFPSSPEPLAAADPVLDGPYVLYRNNQVFLYQVIGQGAVKAIKLDSFPIADKKKIMLEVKTDEPGKVLRFPLRDKITNEKSEFRKVSKQLVISDIEGNFSALRKLLQAGGVIDENYNWTFGNGHLLLVGDFVDRGDHQTEVLWLVYYLEEKARAAGGYVHFVLGNHEIMNMSGDLRYLHPKYTEHNQLMGLYHMTLYGAESEIGRWLRSKNVVEKVDNQLYVHGGISRKVNAMNLSISKINDLARPFYADTTLAYPDANTDTLYQDYGPFWYRGYYVQDVATATDILDSSFQLFRVREVVTGHTLVRDTISVWYDGRLYNVDTPHAKGKSEALLIEGGSHFRVLPDGRKIPIGG